MAPLTVTLSSFKRAEFGVRPIRLRHYREHTVSEVALPLVKIGMTCYSFCKTLPKMLVFVQKLPSDFNRRQITSVCFIRTFFSLGVFLLLFLFSFAVMMLWTTTGYRLRFVLLFSLHVRLIELSRGFVFDKLVDVDTFWGTDFQRLVFMLRWEV